MVPSMRWRARAMRNSAPTAPAAPMSRSPTTAARRAWSGSGKPTQSLRGECFSSRLEARLLHLPLLGLLGEPGEPGMQALAGAADDLILLARRHMDGDGDRIDDPEAGQLEHDDPGAGAVVGAVQRRPGEGRLVVRVGDLLQLDLELRHVIDLPRLRPKGKPKAWPIGTAGRPIRGVNGPSPGRRSTPANSSAAAAYRGGVGGFGGRVALPGAFR